MGVLDFIFDPAGKAAPTYESIQQRRKIAAAMAARQSRAPKNIGEGLSAIGEALGERYYDYETNKQANEARGYEAGRISGAPPDVPPSVTPYSLPQTPPVSAPPPPSPPAAVTPPPPPTPPRAAAPGSGAVAMAPAATRSLDVEDPQQPPQAAAAAAPPAPGAPPPGFRPPPAYLAAALRERIQDPTRRAYLGQLAGKEAQTPGEVSPTGAAGPFQFIRSTGRQYGLVGPGGDRRTDVNASIDAANKLTDDNAAVLERGLGRPPTPGELALAHQQGAGTAVKMLSGTGNAPAYNLSVNNAGGLGGRAAADKIMAYYAMPGGPDPRDTNAAVVADRGQPPGGPAAAQDSLLAEVTGMAGPTSAMSYAPTAALGKTGDVQSDMPPVTGATVSGPVGQSVVDSVQQRDQQRNNITRAIAPQTPPVPGPQIAQAAAVPPVATDAPAGPVIHKAPPAQRLEQPPAPKLLPMTNDRIRYFEGVASDPRVSDTGRAMAMKHVEDAKAQIKAVNDQTLLEYNDLRKRWVDQNAPEKIYAAEKARRELEADVPTPLTPEQRKAYGIPDSLPAAMTRDGKIQYGPAGTHIKVNSDNKPQEKGDEEAQQKLSQHFVKTFETGDAAADELRQVAQMRALAAKVGTGPGAVMRLALGNWGIKTDGLDELQALQAGVSRMIPTQRAPGSGPASDFDGEHFKNSLFALSKTDGGNRLIFDTMEGLAKNKLARSEVAGLTLIPLDAGGITRGEGVKRMLALQQEARALSDRVKEYTDATNPNKAPAPAIPDNATMQQWLQQNPNHPKAGVVRDLLQKGGQ